MSSLSRADPPSVASLAHLKPRDAAGAFHLAFALTLTALALALSVRGEAWLWLPGQVLLAFALLCWFAVLHEAGHKCLFRTSWLNTFAGYLAGFFALIPFDSWRWVHARHHHWTGWQDLDLTTATLVPRPLGWLERFIVNACWLLNVPLFSTIYRINNYWNVPRLWRYVPSRARRWRILLGVIAYLTAYVLCLVALGPWQTLWLFGLGVYLTLVLQDPLILSQHTHIPMHQSEGQAVKPFAPAEQEVYTRSLEFPPWFARLILLNMDAHELHHRYPRVPGYDLHRVAYRPQNLVPWWRWLLSAKRIRGDVLLFQNRNQTGYTL